MFYPIDHKFSAAQLGLAPILNETTMFLTSPNSTRKRRGSSVGLATVAAVGRFGGGLAVGGSDSCGFREISGNCQDQFKANAENFRCLVDFENPFTEYVPDFMTNTNEKLFLVENELAALNAFQSEMAATQDKNWVLIREQLANLERIFHFLRDSLQLLSANQQLNFNFDTVSSILSMIHAAWKAIAPFYWLSA